MSSQMHKKFKAILRRRKFKEIYRSCLPSSYSDASRKFDKLGFIGSQKSPLKHSTAMRTRAEFKSEEHDITGTELESLISSHGASETALGSIEPSKPWWEQFPKH